MRGASAALDRLVPRQRRTLRDVGQPAAGRRGVAREVWAVLGAGFALAVAMTWPALRHPATTLPHDLIDPGLIGWAARWGAYALLHAPGNLFEANAFHPESDTYAFSDTLLGYWPVGLLGDGPRGAAVAVNVIYVLACAIASVGGYALARQLGAGRLGAAVGGIAVAYAPWRLAHVGHPHVISTGGIMLALAMLARGHGFSIRHGLRAERGHVGWIVGGWLVAAWQITIGFGVGLVFAYVLAGLCLTATVLWWRRGRPRVRRAVLLADLGGGLAFAVAGLLMSLPYLRVVAEHPNARRGVEELDVYSPPVTAFLAGPVESLLWHDDPLGLRSTVPQPTEMTLLPGVFLLVLAGIGLRMSVWPARWRPGLGIAALVSIALAMGTRLGLVSPYLLLYQLPGWDALRTPGRLVVWTTLLLALLAAGAVTAATERLSRTSLSAAYGRFRSHPYGRRVWAAYRRFSARQYGRWLATGYGRSRAALGHVPERLRPRLGHAVGVLAAALVLVEGLSAMPHVQVPDPPEALIAEHANEVEPPLLVLPSTQTFDPMVMLWSTDGFPEMVNGLSGFTPASQAEIRTGTYSFPDAASVSLLRRYGVRTVVVLRDWIAGTPWAQAADAPVTGLDITRSDIDDAVVYSLS